MFSSRSKAAALKQAWDRSLVLGRQSYDLFSAIMARGAGRSSSYKDVLLEEAQSNQNALAQSLLSVEREYSKMKYYGPLQYVKQEGNYILPARAQQWMFGSSDDGSGKLQQQTDTASNKTTVAKVAFMITTGQRQELTEKLQYQEADIKKMTPLEATLILQNDVIPDQRDERLPALIEAHKAALQEERARQQKKTVEDELKETFEAGYDESLQSSTSEHDQQSSDSNPFLFRDETLTSKIWFEVIEERKGQQIPLALYDSEKEAFSVVKLKQDIAERDAKDHRIKHVTEPPTYKIRQTRR
jgi:hypothetical protein